MRPGKAARSRSFDAVAVPSPDSLHDVPYFGRRGAPLPAVSRTAAFAARRRIVKKTCVKGGRYLNFAGIDRPLSWRAIIRNDAGADIVHSASTAAATLGKARFDPFVTRCFQWQSRKGSKVPRTTP